MYLAGAGVGTLGLVDGDVVELSNLHRQVLHSVETLGMPKVQSATRYLTRWAVPWCGIESVLANDMIV